MSYSSYDSAGQPSAPPLPGHDSDDSEFIAPQWVQRLYGPPPPRQPPPNHHAPSPAGQQGGGDWRPPPPPHHFQQFDVQAYTPGAQPRAGPAGGLRGRSPSAATILVADSAGGYDLHQPGAHLPDASPTKTPLLATDGPPPRPSAPPTGGGGGGLRGGSATPAALHALGDDATRPSRALALRERHRRQLRTCSKDAFGVPLPRTSRPFSLFAPPASIAEVCAGLGVYLSSLQAAVVLALLLSVCSIYPLANNLTTQRWARQYALYTAGEAAGVSATCAKGWGSTSWLTQMTIGGHCSGTTYSSRFDCSAKCVWDPAALRAPRCRGQPPPGSRPANATAAAAAGGACAQHLPCATARLDPAAADGPCYCCDLRLDEAAMAANPRVPAAQLWVLLVGQLLFMGWMLYLMHTQLAAAGAVGARVVGPSDFSVWISGIRRKRTGDAPLAHWCGQYGPVVAALNVPSVGDAVRVGARVEELELRLAESAALEGSTSCNPLQWVYRLLTVGSHRSILDRLDAQRLKLAVYERQEAEPTGQGLATFEFAESAAACVAAFDRPPLRRLLDAATFGYTNATPRLHGAVVHVARAPDPSDVIWAHTNCTGAPAFFRRAASWTATTAIMLAGAGVQYGLAVMAERERAGRMQAEYAAGTGAPWAVAAAAAKTRRLRAISVLAGVMVAAVNLGVMAAVRALSWRDRWTTRTSMERWVTLKLSVSLLTNAFAAPVLAAYLSGSLSGWYSRGGLMEAAFFVQCANGVAVPLFHLLGAGDNLRWYLLSHFARTQAQLDRLLAPPPFPLAEQHASAVTTVGLALWYMPVLPISPLIALVGLSVSYCANKYCALRRAAAPPNLSGMVTTPVNWLLRLLPLVQLVLMKELYYRDYPTITPVFYTGLSFWLLFMMAPIRALLGVVRRRRATPATGLSYHRCLGGKRLGAGETYAPAVPKPCSRKFRQKVAATFELLAPAAFLSVSPGDEGAAAAAAAGLHAGAAAAAKGGLRAAAPPRRLDASGGAAAAGRHHPAAGSRTNLRASIAAGVQGTWDLLWTPHDADHPDEVFVRPGAALEGHSLGAGAGAAHRVSGAGSTGSSGGGEGGAPQESAAFGTPAPGSGPGFIPAVRAHHAPPSAPAAPRAPGGRSTGPRGPRRVTQVHHDPFSPLRCALPPHGDDMA